MENFDRTGRWGVIRNLEGRLEVTLDMCVVLFRYSTRQRSIHRETV
jgi:hypothetical protein